MAASIPALTQTLDNRFCYRFSVKVNSIEAQGRTQAGCEGIAQTLSNGSISGWFKFDPNTPAADYPYYSPQAKSYVDLTAKSVITASVATGQTTVSPTIARLTITSKHPTEKDSYQFNGSLVFKGDPQYPLTAICSPL
jgi:hypothetical protein